MLSVYVISSYGTEMFRMPLVFTPMVAVQTVLCAVAFTLAAHALVQWTIHRMDWLEAVKTSE